jgi:hypothetical protein
LGEATDECSRRGGCQKIRIIVASRNGSAGF